MSTPHNRANPGDFAKTVLMPGDPLRAKFIAETFLENPRLVTDVRGMLGYTGTYQGHPVSVMGSGMGMPSIGIYSYALPVLIPKKPRSLMWFWLPELILKATMP